MIYRSNLSAPDIQPYFRHSHCRVQPQSCGHDVVSDWADKCDDDPVFDIYKRCGFQTHSEAAILYNVAKQISGTWVDIGAATGWTACHIALAGCNVWAVEPMFGLPEFRDRFDANVAAVQEGFAHYIDSEGYPFRTRIHPFGGRSDEFFSVDPCQLAEPPDCERFDGVMVDGDHGAPNPLLDADRAAMRLRERGVIMFHDAIGGPVQDAIKHLMNLGFYCRIYWTPHVVAVCWRGEFTPPDHVADPAIEPWLRPQMAGFPFERCE